MYGAIIGAATSLVQMGVGAMQANKGSKMKAKQSGFKELDKYKERMDRLKMREANAGSLPGQDLMENKIGASTAQGITAMKEAGNQASFSNMVAQSVQNEQDALADVGIKAAQRRDDIGREVEQGLKDGEKYGIMKQEREFEMQAAQLAKKQALSGAGSQNIMGGLSSMASGAMSLDSSNKTAQ